MCEYEEDASLSAQPCTHTRARESNHARAHACAKFGKIDEVWLSNWKKLGKFDKLPSTLCNFEVKLCQILSSLVQRRCTHVCARRYKEDARMCARARRHPHTLARTHAHTRSRTHARTCACTREHVRTHALAHPCAHPCTRVQNFGNKLMKFGVQIGNNLGTWSNFINFSNF